MGEKCHVRSLSIEYKLKLHTHFFINAREYWGQIYASRPVLTRWLNWRARRLIRSKEVPPPSSHYVTRCHCFSAVSAAGRRCAASGVLFAAVPVGLVCCRCDDVPMHLITYTHIEISYNFRAGYLGRARVGQTNVQAHFHSFMEE